MLSELQYALLLHHLAIVWQPEGNIPTKADMWPMSLTTCGRVCVCVCVHSNAIAVHTSICHSADCTMVDVTTQQHLDALLRCCDYDDLQGVSLLLRQTGSPSCPQHGERSPIRVLYDGAAIVNWPSCAHRQRVHANIGNQAGGEATNYLCGAEPPASSHQPEARLAFVAVSRDCERMLCEESALTLRRYALLYSHSPPALVSRHRIRHGLTAAQS